MTAAFEFGAWQMVILFQFCVDIKQQLLPLRLALGLTLYTIFYRRLMMEVVASGMLDSPSITRGFICQNRQILFMERTVVPQVMARPRAMLHKPTKYYVVLSILMEMFLSPVVRILLQGFGMLVDPAWRI
jgi:hypothetical protein